MGTFLISLLLVLQMGINIVFGIPYPREFETADISPYESPSLDNKIFHDETETFEKKPQWHNFEQEACLSCFESNGSYARVNDGDFECFSIEQFQQMDSNHDNEYECTTDADDCLDWSSPEIAKLKSDQDGLLNDPQKSDTSKDSIPTVGNSLLDEAFPGSNLPGFGQDPGNSVDEVFIPSSEQRLTDALIANLNAVEIDEEVTSPTPAFQNTGILRKRCDDFEGCMKCVLKNHVFTYPPGKCFENAAEAPRNQTQFYVEKACKWYCPAAKKEDEVSNET